MKDPGLGEVVEQFVDEETTAVGRDVKEISLLGVQRPVLFSRAESLCTVEVGGTVSLDLWRCRAFVRTWSLLNIEGSM